MGMRTQGANLPLARPLQAKRPECIHNSSTITTNFLRTVLTEKITEAGHSVLVGQVRIPGGIHHHHHLPTANYLVEDIWPPQGLTIEKVLLGLLPCTRLCLLTAAEGLPDRHTSELLVLIHTIAGGRPIPI